ncbi:MAG: hypothetical protein WCC11_03655 [Gammaproteobacteria bacterium]
MDDLSVESQPALSTEQIQRDLAIANARADQQEQNELPPTLATFAEAVRACNFDIRIVKALASTLLETFYNQRIYADYADGFFLAMGIPLHEVRWQHAQFVFAKEKEIYDAHDPDMSS